MAKQKYRLLLGSGKHREGTLKEGNLKIYVGGDIIMSDRPLDKIFKNKFENVKSRRSTKPSDDDSDGTGDEVEPTLRAMHKGGGRWHVVRLEDGEPTEDVVHDGYLTKDEATDLIKAGVEEDNSEE